MTMKKLTHSEILNERLRPEDAHNVERHPVSLMLDNVRSLYNVGSIFRTCDSALASELILCGFTPHPPRKEIEKTALGAVETVPWTYKRSSHEAVNELKSRNIKVIAVEITGKKRPYDTFSADEYPMCLVLGNELTGLDNSLLNLCDDAVEIPMFGAKHSLNVSVAAGIVLFEAVRKFRLYQNNT